MNNMKVILIIPAYNEEESIIDTVNSIKEYNKKNKTKIDYIVINDGSTDKTGDLLKENSINHINLVYNLGIGGAVQTGYKYAYENNYDYAVQYDGDGQHDINYLNYLLEPLINNEADLTIGSRFINKSNDFKSTISRRIGIKIISLLILICTHKKVLDTTSGFRAANNSVIKFFASNYPKECPEPESTVNILRLGYKVKEIPVKMKKRKAGKSSIIGFKKIYYMIDVFFSIIITSLKGRKNL